MTEASSNAPQPGMSRTEIDQNLHDLLGQWGPADTFPVESLGVRRSSLVVEDYDPIHYDAEAASARGYRGIVAPWPFLWAIIHNLLPGDMPFRFGRATLHGSDSYEFFEPLIVGDLITCTTVNTEATLKQGRSGLLGHVITERRFVNQLGQLCAIVKTVTIRR
jgi:acyl dehydratase